MARTGDTRCAGCGLIPRLCLCGDVRRADNTCEVVVVRHRKERTLGSNSGRLALLALSRVRLIEWGGLTFEGLDLSGDTWVLARSGGSIPDRVPERIVVMDGSWRQADKMLRRVPGVSELPKL